MFYSRLPLKNFVENRKIVIINCENREKKFRNKTK